MAGYASNADGTKQDDALARYNRDGSLDPSFGAGGKVVTRVGPGQDWAVSLAVQRNGQILTGGHSWNGVDFDFAKWIAVRVKKTRQFKNLESVPIPSERKGL